MAEKMRGRDSLRRTNNLILFFFPVMPTYQKARDRVSGGETLPLHFIERLRAKAPLLAGMGAPARHKALPGDTASPSAARLGTCHLQAALAWGGKFSDPQ